MSVLNSYKQAHPDIKPIPRESKTVRRSSFADQPRPTAKGLFQIPVIRALFFSGFFLCYTSTAYDVLLVLFAFTPSPSAGSGSTQSASRTCSRPRGSEARLCRSSRCPGC